MVLVGSPPATEVTYLLLRPGMQPLRLTPAANSLRFSTLATGGFGSASITLAGPPARWHKAIPYLSRLVVTYGERTVYEGQVEDIGRTLQQGELATTLSCFGLQRKLDEVAITRLYLKQGLDFRDNPAAASAPTGAWTFQSGQIDPTDLTKIGIVYTGTESATVGSSKSRLAIWWAPPNVEIRRFYYTWNRIGAHAFHGEVGYYDNSGSYSKTEERASGGSFSVDFPAGAVGIGIGVEVDSGASGFIPENGDQGQFYHLAVLCTVLNPDTTGTDARDLRFYGGTVIRDLITYTPDLREGIIEAGSDFGIPSIARDARDKVGSYLREIAAYYDREWAVWEDGRFDWKSPNVNQPQWIVPLKDLVSLSVDGSVDEIVRTVYLEYLDAAAGVPAEQSAAATDQRNPYVKQNARKDMLASAGFPMTSTSAAQLASRLAADNGGYPPVSGRVVLNARKQVKHAQSGGAPAILVRAGENLLIPDLPSSDPFAQGRDGETLFHIVSTEFNEAAGQVVLEVEGYAKRGDQLLARLAAVTKIVTG